MPITRRTLLKGVAAVGAATVAPARAAEAKPEVQGPLRGMLYDATLCIGCKACMAACREANGVAYSSDTTLWDAPVDLSANEKNVIKLFAEGNRTSFVKMQCMHCVDPACVSACMLGALKKRGVGGAVTWDGDLCVGCRYCQVACPFDVPKFEWERRDPHIVKCELCNHRVEKGGIPACVEVCPREAVIYGEREQLLQEAKRRIAETPDRYNPKIYGEKDAGGTQVLYLAPKNVTFAELGFPDVGDEAVPERVRGVNGVLYKYFAAPVGLYAVLGAVIFRNHRTGGVPDAPAVTDEGQQP